MIPSFFLFGVQEKKYVKKGGKDNWVETIYFKHLTQIFNGFPILNIPKSLSLYITLNVDSPLKFFKLKKNVGH